MRSYLEILKITARYHFAHLLWTSVPCDFELSEKNIYF